MGASFRAPLVKVSRHLRTELAVKNIAGHWSLSITMEMGHGWAGVGVGVRVGMWEPENKLVVVVEVSKLI